MDLTLLDGKLRLHIKYHVSAYDESGYGWNESRDFDDEAAAVAYAQGLVIKYAGSTWPRLGNPTVSKTVTMDPIFTQIPLPPTPKGDRQ